MNIEIDSALAERLAAGHDAETARRRAADTAGDRASEATEALEALLHPLRGAVLRHCPSVRFLQEADTRIAKVGPGALVWTWAVPVGPDGWFCEPEVRPAFDVAAHAEIGVKVLSDTDAGPGAGHQAGDRGRIHSLWYCDAFEANRFEWAELGFVVTKEDGGMFPGEGIAPSARAPGPPGGGRSRGPRGDASARLSAGRPRERGGAPGVRRPLARVVCRRHRRRISTGDAGAHRSRARRVAQRVMFTRKETRGRGGSRSRTAGAMLS